MCKQPSLPLLALACWVLLRSHACLCKCFHGRRYDGMTSYGSAWHFTCDTIPCFQDVAPSIMLTKVREVILQGATAAMAASLLAKKILCDLHFMDPCFCYHCGKSWENMAWSAQVLRATRWWAPACDVPWRDTHTNFESARAWNQRECAITKTGMHRRCMFCLHLKLSQHQDFASPFYSSRWSTLYYSKDLVKMSLLLTDKCSWTAIWSFEESMLSPSGLLVD